VTRLEPRQARCPAGEPRLPEEVLRDVDHKSDKEASDLARQGAKVADSVGHTTVKTTRKVIKTAKFW
jgi:hypothetical protein